MNNYNFTQSLDGLNNIDADNINSTNATFSNANITSLINCNLINCNTSTTPVSPNNIVNKSYVDNNFIDFTTDQQISGTKRFNNFFCTALNITPNLGGSGNRQQIYVTGTEIAFVPLFANNFYSFYCSNGVTQTNAVKIQSASTTITNNLITNNLTADVVTGTQNIYTTNTTGIINIGTGQTTGNLNLGTTSSFTNINSSLLLRTKKKINEMNNITSDTTVVLSFPLSETNIIRTITPTLTSLTITLPAVTANERGMLFNFFKFRNNLNVTFTSTSPIFTLNDTTNIFYSNTTLLSSDKRMTTLMCGFYSTLNYWIEVSNYSTFDRDYNNTIYPRLLIANTFTNTNIFNAQTTFNNSTPICSVAIPTANDHLVRKDYCDTNFMFKSGAVPENIGGVKTFLNRIVCNGGVSLEVTNSSVFNGSIDFNAQVYFANFTPFSYITATNPNHIPNKNYIDSNFAGLTSTNSFSGVNTFTYNVNCSSSITFTDIANFSTIQQNSAVLNIENPTLSSTIRLKTRASTGAVQNSLILNTSSCDILSPTLNLTGASPISILTPNNLNGTINLFNNLTTGGTLNIGSNAGVNIINGNTTINNKLVVGVNGNTGLNLEVLQQLYFYHVGAPYTDYGRILNVGSGITRYHSYSPIQGFSSKHDFYSSLTGADDATKVVSFETGASLTKVYNTFEVAGTSTFSDIIICDNGATFNNVIPTTNISATSGDELVNYTTLTSQGFVTSSSILSANNNFTGFNTFSSGLTVRSTLLLKDITNVLQGSIDLLSGGLLTIGCSVYSGKIILSTQDSVGNSYNRLFVNENEVNITAPLTLFVDYSYYNPGVFTSTRLGYSKSNTGSSNTLTNNNVNNSGRINIDAGSWNISYTATLTVISATLTTLKSLDVYVGDVALNDLNIIGLNVLNYYNTSSVPIGQKIKISGSGNYISYTNVSTELNLLILPLFTAGLAGLTFQGKISATRNA